MYKTSSLLRTTATRKLRPTSSNLLKSPFLIPKPQQCSGLHTNSSSSIHNNSSKLFPSIKGVGILGGISLLTAGTYFYYPKHTVEAESSLQSPILTASSPYHQSLAKATVDDLLDDGSRTAVAARSTQELLLGLFVYKLCTFSLLVDMAPHVIAFAEKCHLEGLVYEFVKQTFFKQFCGGETPEECIQCMDKLAQSGINCILDLSVEADLHLEQTDVPQLYDELSQPLGKWWRQEQSADVIVTMTEHSIKTASRGGNELNNGAFAAIKVTAFAPPELLLRLNNAITKMEQIFQAHQVDGLVGTQALKDVVQHVLPPPANEQQQEQRESMIQYIHHHQPHMDILSFSQFFNLNSPNRDIWWSTNETVQEDKCLLTHDELQAYDRMVNRLEQVCTLAHRLGVGIMVDAEQSYFQEAIDHVALNLQQKFNRRDESDHAPTVYNTYQMYTKAARAKLERDVEFAKRNNITFAAKLVRGAYMVSERKRALELGYPSPIHDTLEDTHASFNGGVTYLLSKINEYQSTTDKALTSSTSPIVFMVASHNRDSIVQTVQAMEQYGVSPKAGVVHFGQLFGMQDQISYTLGNHGYSIYKYLPYGMIDEVIPYLLRRAQENSSVLGAVSRERNLMWSEVKDRIKKKILSSASNTSHSSSTVSSSMNTNDQANAVLINSAAASTPDDTDVPIKTTTA